MPDIEKIIEVAVGAGKKILDIYQKNDFGERIKKDNSPLTEADIASHQYICKQLQKLTPDLPVLSEESATIPWEVRKSWQRYWLVDPLDGTKEFIKRNGEFTVNIALVFNHCPVLGVVHAPAFDTTWAGGENNPSIKICSEQKKNIKVSHHETGKPWKVVGSRSHAGGSLNTFLDHLETYELISMGSSIKFCLVAEGQADIYPRFGPTSEWDTAAAHAIVNAAGGEVITIENKQPLYYNKKNSLLNPYFIAKHSETPCSFCFE